MVVAKNCITSCQRVLDVGVGQGPYRHLFRDCDYFAHDFGMEPETIGNYAKLDYQSDITAIPVPDESFDVILCTEVLEHGIDSIKAIQEMARILRPGGTMLLTAPSDRCYTRSRTTSMVALHLTGIAKYYRRWGWRFSAWKEMGVSSACLGRKRFGFIPFWHPGAFQGIGKCLLLRYCGW